MCGYSDYYWGYFRVSINLQHVRFNLNEPELPSSSSPLHPGEVAVGSICCVPLLACCLPRSTSEMFLHSSKNSGLPAAASAPGSDMAPGNSNSSGYHYSVNCFKGIVGGRKQRGSRPAGCRKISVLGRYIHSKWAAMLLFRDVGSLRMPNRFWLWAGSSFDAWSKRVMFFIHYTC